MCKWIIENIFRFYVSVADTLFLKVFNSKQDFFKNISNLAFIFLLLVTQIGTKVRKITVLAHHIGNHSLFIYIKSSWLKEVFMVEGSHEFEAFFEILHELFIFSPCNFHCFGVL